MLMLLQEATNQGPEWLLVARTAGQALQGFVTALGIIIGGIFAYYKFFRQGEHDPRLQPTVTGTATRHGDIVLVVATVRAQNTGQVDVTLDLESSGLEVLTTKAGDEGWTHRHIIDVFRQHRAVQPGETIEDQAWFEIPYDGEAGIKLNLTVAPTENLSYPTTEIITLLPERGENRREGG